MPVACMAVRAPRPLPVRGRMSFTPAARKAARPAFRRVPKAVTFRLPPWVPRFGMVGSSFAVPVAYPIHGPPAVTG